jgi:hypothetical protein
MADHLKLVLNVIDGRRSPSLSPPGIDQRAASRQRLVWPGNDGIGATSSRPLFSLFSALRRSLFVDVLDRVGGNALALASVRAA